MQVLRTDLYRFMFRHAVLVPAAFALAALIAEMTSIDISVSNFFYDAQLSMFPAHEIDFLDLLGHRLGKSAVLGVWLVLLGWVSLAPLFPAIRTDRRVWGAALLGMSLGPVVVVLLKGINSRHCPWDLKMYGGAADLSADWFVSATEVGHCFPGGHASSGFCLVALMFAGKFLGNEKLARIGLVSTVVAGSLFSLVRMAQGAHFLSHNLWSAAICWCFAALAFCIVRTQSRSEYSIKAKHEVCCSPL